MSSFTTQGSNQSSEYYSTAPFSWLTDSKILERDNREYTVPGIFLKENVRDSNLVDKESYLSGINEKIGKCENVDIQALNKAKELSAGLQNVYDTNITTTNNGSNVMVSTRLANPPDSLSEKQTFRENILLFNPQDPSYIIRNVDTRGGAWTRNNFKDNYSCPPAENRGGNAN